jgi:hypothetical protein
MMRHFLEPHVRPEVVACFLAEGTPILHRQPLYEAANNDYVDLPNQSLTRALFAPIPVAV